MPAIPVFLSGQGASLVLSRAVQPTAPVRLVLDWADGSVTELQAEIVDVEGAGRILHLEVVTVSGDWRPFVDYLGREQPESLAVDRMPW